MPKLDYWSRRSEHREQRERFTPAAWAEAIGWLSLIIFVVVGVPILIGLLIEWLNG